MNKAEECAIKCQGYAQDFSCGEFCERLAYTKRGPEVDFRQQIAFRLIRRFSFDRVLRHMGAISKACGSAWVQFDTGTLPRP